MVFDGSTISAPTANGRGLRAMTREEAIKRLHEMIFYCAIKSDESESMAKFWRDSVDAIDMAISALKEQPRWISVEERLPKAEKEVRVICKASWNPKYFYQCQAFYEPKGMLKEKSDYGWDYECCGEYSEEDDDYFVNPGWYERIHNWDDYSAVGILDEVTHWMPLPEPPKEEV